jgi:hypothetical protein
MGMLPSSAPNRRALNQARALWTVPEENQLLTGCDGRRRPGCENARGQGEHRPWACGTPRKASLTARPGGAGQ